MKNLNVSYTLTDDLLSSLEAVHKKYTEKYNKDDTIEECFQFMMESGCNHIIEEKIKFWNEHILNK